MSTTPPPPPAPTGARADARIDLHSHSTWSDGTLSVPELFEEARAARLDVLALTDHDTVEGWAELPAAVAASGVAAVPGIEVSAELGRMSVHVLALLVDPGPDTALAAELEKARRSRSERAQRMVELIAEDYPITWDAVRDQVADEATVIGRPHIADALIAAGVVSERADAFARILSPSGPYYVRHYAPSPARAVEVIRQAGGVAIAAHPASGMREGAGASLEEILGPMIQAGLAALEVDHREHDAVSRARLRALARENDLLVTGGSDYHGSGKPNLLAENLTSPEALGALISLSTSRTEVIHP